MYSPPGGGGNAVQSLAAADPTVTVGGTATARTVKVAKQLDHTFITDFDAEARAAQPRPTYAKMGGLVSPMATLDIVASSAGAYSLLPIVVQSPMHATGLSVWVGSTASNDGLKVQARLYSPDGQTILADSGQVAAPTATSQVNQVLFAAAYDIVTPGTYWIGFGVQGNGTYARHGFSNGRLTGARAGAWPLPATLDPTLSNVGTQTCTAAALI